MKNIDDSLTITMQCEPEAREKLFDKARSRSGFIQPLVWGEINLGDFCIIKIDETFGDPLKDSFIRILKIQLKKVFTLGT